MDKILLLEDDESLNRGISLKLEKEGYEVLRAVSVRQANDLFDKHEVVLVISDITVEDGDGLSFCRSIRERSQVHFIFLTALDQEVDIVNGYDAGADDYITKPFSLMVLISKVNVLMRRIGARDESSGNSRLLRSGDLEVNCREMKAYKGGEEILLSKKEFQLLLYFLENPRQVISKEQILSAVWDVDGQFVDDNTVPATISRLKKKVAGRAHPAGCIQRAPHDADSSEADGLLLAEYIKNVRGMGYIWTVEVSSN